MKKFLEPIIVSICLIAYYVLYFAFLITFLEGFWKLIFALFPIVFAILIIKVCIERIKEIKEMNEDDISKY